MKYNCWFATEKKRREKEHSMTSKRNMWTLVKIYVNEKKHMIESFLEIHHPNFEFRQKEKQLQIFFQRRKLNSSELFNSMRKFILSPHTLAVRKS